MTTPQLIVSPRAHERIAAVRSALEALAPGAEALLVAPHQEAADDLVRGLTIARGAVFGIHRLTLGRLAGLLAAETLAAEGLVPISALALEAVAARAVYRLKGSGEIAYFAAVAGRPGFAAALARTLEELRLSRVAMSELRRLGAGCAALAALAARFAVELREAKLVDRAETLAIATAAAHRDPPPRFCAIPACFLDLAITSVSERDLIAALAARAPSVIAVVPAGDAASRARLEEALACKVSPFNSAGAGDAAATDATSLRRLQDFLFSDEQPAERKLDASVALISAPGEMHECVEIARRIQREAHRGVAFDQMAVLLHAPSRYGPHLKEAFHRAGVPAYFASGTRLPEPGGRALLALLACAAEHLSARRFAEYLSLAQVPDPGIERETDGAPRTTGELAAAALSADLEVAPPYPESAPTFADPVPVVEGSVRAPWRWERLLVDAAVIGHQERWRRRLAGLARELERKRAEVADDDARAAALQRTLLDLKHLSEVAMPLIERLDGLPHQASWGEWLEHLRALTGAAVRDSGPVLTALAELEPMAPVGPVGLDEVREVLAERLGNLEDLPRARRYGAVFVAPTGYARGLSFQVTLIPGLAERVFPQRLTEDPLLPDREREVLSPALVNQQQRVANQRAALGLAIGAAAARVMLTYPRVDLDQSRPRVPSFYTLEVMRAAEGRLPGFDELARRAACEQAVRLGWPAPADPALAIDDAEFDLAVLDKLLDRDPATTVGAAHYLLSANPYLGRALRTRARRWLRRWTPADGLVEPDLAERAALARHQLSARSYSATALQNFAACPYRFLLKAVHRLEPREEAEAIEVIDPLTRGSLFHEVQFELLTALRAVNALPVTAATLVCALEMVDRTLDRVAERFKEELAPAIERVWQDGIDSIRADLREWLRRSADLGWRPERFELAFGLSDRAQADPASTTDPISILGGLNLRGSIDLVERGAEGRLRVTDHKTGRVYAQKEAVIGGGVILQPVLYALAAQELLGEVVESGRLYYCTAAGGYEERTVALDDKARASAIELARIIGGALSEGFLPAAPDDNECSRCDYRLVCGPYEEQRSALKPARRLAELRRLREMP